MRESIPQPLTDELKQIEPNAGFTGSLPRVQSSSGKLYFAKMGSLSEVEQYTGEVESLKAIEAAAPGLVPRVLSFERDTMNRPILISEYKELGRLTDLSAKAILWRHKAEERLVRELGGVLWGYDQRSAESIQAKRVVWSVVQQGR